MSISWYCMWAAQDGIPPTLDSFDRAALVAELTVCPGLIVGHLMVPTSGEDPYYPDTKNQTSLLLQLEFGDVQELESCLSAAGHLACLAEADRWPSLAGTSISHQAMLTRHYPVAEPSVASKDGSTLSYMVEYDGATPDENAWHLAYMGRHPFLLAKFPGIRAIEISTPATIVTSLPIRIRHAMQRNKTVFDSSEAMNAAMTSKARQALREDFLTLPPLVGSKDHLPFHSVAIKGPATAGGGPPGPRSPARASASLELT